MKRYDTKLIDLEVRTDNEKAIQFYKKHSFLVTDIVKGLYQNNEDAYVMKRKI